MGDPLKDLEAVAALAAHTNAFVNEQKENMVSEAESLKAGNFDAKSFLKTHVQQAQAEGALPPPPPSQPQPQPQYVNPQDMIPQAAPPQQVQYVAPPQQAVQAHITLPPNVEERLTNIEKTLSDISDTLTKLGALDKKFSKFMEKGVEGRVKQITLRLDDPKDKK
tara:strand:+ start:8238 stop:8732 length:495 start_codon:yes stop_codon:yes gene_type:complete